MRKWLLEIRYKGIDDTHLDVANAPCIAQETLRLFVWMVYIYKIISMNTG